VNLPRPSSPYKGLAAFEDSELDALLFFGRDKDSQIIATNLLASPLTILFGPTGVGKTSVLRAGVAQALRSHDEIDVRIHSAWTGDAGEALANLAADGGRDLCIILDQFEEFFLYHETDRSFAPSLAQVLRAARPRANVLIGIREDSLALLDRFKSDIPNLLSNRLRLNRLDRAGGEAAIVKPLDRYNELARAEVPVQIEPALVREVLDQVAAGRVELPGAGRGSVGEFAVDEIEAPYLQLVMSRIWEVESERRTNELTLSTFRELGGATQIVRDHLDRAMSTLSPREQDRAAALYNHLVTPSGTKIAHDVRDLAGYAGLAEADVLAVLDRLADERIVRGGTENGGAKRYEIYHDVLADAVVGWRNRHEAERALREAERHRRRAVFVAATALLGLLLVGAVALFALIERHHAQTDASRAEARELVASAGRDLATNPQRSLSLALQSAELEQGAHEEDALRQALLAANELAVMRATRPILVARFSPSGNRIVTGSRDGRVRIYRTGLSRPLKVLSQGGPVTALDWSRNGRQFLTGGGDRTIRIWTSGGVLRATVRVGGAPRSAFFLRHDSMLLAVTANGVVRTWRVRDKHPLHRFTLERHVLPKRVAVDPTGHLLATAEQDRFARLYSLDSGKLLRRLPQLGFIHCVAFDPKGKLLFTCGHEGAGRVWSVPGGALIKRLRGPGPKSPLLNGAVASNGILVAAGVADATARVWEAPTGFQVGTMFGHGAPLTDVAFSPNNRALVTGSLDNTARTWVVNGRPVEVFAGHTGSLNAVSFSPDGRRVLTASDDGTARLWSSGTEPELEQVVRQTPITAFALSPNGKRILVGDARGVARVRAVGRARVLATIRVKDPISAVAFGPHGPLVATRPTLAIASLGRWIIRGRSDGSVLVQGPRDYALVAGRSPITAVALSPGARQLAAGDAKGLVTLWDTQTRRKLRTLSGHRLAVTSIDFSPGGGQLLTASRDHEVRSWDWQTGRALRVRKWHVGPVNGAAFSRDGRWIVTAGPGTAGVGKSSSDQRVRILHGPETMLPLVGAGFAGADDHTIVTASRDGTIRVYRCEICGDIAELMAIARRRLALNSS
jgi:WD40 repeat protein